MSKSITYERVEGMGDAVRQDATRQLVEIARAFYLEKGSKVDIARRFGVTRFQVARMLEEATESGIVTIEIHDPDDYASALGEQVAGVLGIPRVAVVETSTMGPAETNERIARAVVETVRGFIRPRMTLGMSWSRTLDVAARFLTDLPPCDLVQLAGALQLPGSGALPLTITRLGGCPGVRAWPVYAPLLVDEASTARDLRRQPEIAQALERADRLDLAVVSIGAWAAGESTVWEKVSEADRRAGERAGAVAEISGRLLDAAGRVVRTTLDERTVAVTAEQLVAAPEVVALARGNRRVAAVRSAVAAGIVTALVVDSDLATAILG